MRADLPEELSDADVKDRPASRPRDLVRSPDSEDLAAMSSEALKGMRVAVAERRGLEGNAEIVALGCLVPLFFEHVFV
jgi:hypothetical protein